MSLWCFHGFLGRGHDWDFLNATLPAQDLRKPDLLAGLPRGEDLWAHAARWVAQIRREDSAPYLLGYSYGGRLALHMLLLAPQLFRGAVLTSTNFGLPPGTDRRVRQERDEIWAQKFSLSSTAIWPALMAEWDDQAVLRSSLSGHRAPVNREDFNPARLAECLRLEGLARQEGLWSRLHEISTPLTLVTGETDDWYNQQAQAALALLPHARHLKVAGVGHRVPWESPQTFAEILANAVVSG